MMIHSKIKTTTKSHWLAPFLGAFLTACATTAGPSGVAAQIPVHSQESLVELRQVIHTALNDHKVYISATAFSDSSQLIIERKPIQGPDGRTVHTGIDEKPIVFRLYKDTQGCYLIDQRNNNQLWLSNADCVAR